MKFLPLLTPEFFLCYFLIYFCEIPWFLNNKFEKSFNIKICALETETEKYKYTTNVTYKLETNNPDSYKELAIKTNHNEKFLNDLLI